MTNLSSIGTGVAQVDEFPERSPIGPIDAGLHRRFELHALRRPSAVAVVDGSTRFTYREINEAANRLAHYLKDLGVGREVMVGVCFERSHELIVAILAVLKAGGAYVPLDPDYPAERLGFVLRDSAVAVVITRQKLPDHLEVSAGCRIVSLADDRELIGRCAAHDLKVEVEADGLLYVIYTSGSTGQPKGVMVTHRNVVRLFDVLGPKLGFCAEDIWSFYHSPAFGYSAWEIWGPLVHGGRLVIVPSSARMSPVELRELLTKEEVSVLSLTPSGFRQLMLNAAFEGDDAVPRLRMIALSGEGVVKADLRRWFANHREGHPDIIDTYAITETGGQVAWRRLGAADAATDVGNLLGELLSDTRVHLLDHHLQPVPPGTNGELCVSGPGLARGYWNRHELTKEKFVQDPKDPGERLYRTGDRGRLRHDGRIVLIGRGDDQVKVRGFRVELGEIESALHDHPKIREAAVVLQDNGGESPRLVAYLTASRPEKAAQRADRQGEAGEAELWPSLGEYQVYDEVLYYFMTSEEVRNAAYKEAIRRHVRDKVVLDIGTGQDAILARFCVEAGAKRVYAIEVLDDAYEKAAKLVQESGLSDRIIVIRGDSTTVQLPESVDVCTEGIIGNIGSSDGIIPIMNDARRWFSPNAIAIPNRCTTYFAAVELPNSLHETPSFGPLPRKYAESIFAQAGHRFDVRLCVSNFPASNIISKAESFEDLDFSGPINPEEDGEALLTITKDGRFDGFLLWTKVTTAPGVAIDYLENQRAWLPVYFPLSDQGIQVNTGDQIEASWRRTLCENGINPDYAVNVAVLRSNGQRTELSYTTRHLERAYLSTGIHRKLFARWEESSTGLSPEELRAFLGRRLPDYMIPGAFMFLDELPHNANGKLDRKLLPAPGTLRPNLATAFAKPENPLQERVAAIWSEVLKIDAVGLDDSFFALGGHSLVAAQIMARIAAKIGVELPLSAVADHPTIRLLSILIEGQTKEPSESFSADQPKENLGTSSSSEDERFMRLAIEKAAEAQRAGGVPFGATIVKNGQVVASVHNGVAHSFDLTAHAEIRAIREACQKLGTTDLSNCEIFSTCEPCPMCFAACHEARISRIVHGAWLGDAERCGLGTLSIPAETLRQLGHASITLTPGVLRNETIALLEGWQKQRRRLLESIDSGKHSEGLYGDNEGFAAYTKAVASSDLLDQAMRVLKPHLERAVTDKPFRILDIGAGTGVLTLRVLEDLASRGTLAEVDYVEPSAAATHLLEDRFEKAGFAKALGDHYSVGWEIAKDLMSSADKGYDLILAHHSLYYAPLSSETVRPLSSLLAPGGRAALFMDAEQSPIVLIREIAGRYLGRKNLQLSGARDLESQLTANVLPFEQIDLEVTWNVSPLFDVASSNNGLRKAMTAFLALVPPSEITEVIERLVTEEARALAEQRDRRWLLRQQSRVFVLHPAEEREIARLPLGSAGVAVVADSRHRHEPFPMTEIQAAYWIGRDNSLQLGNVATHVYEEVDCIDLDVARLEIAWQKLIDRHDMLRAIIQPDGRIKVLEEVPAFRIAVTDLRGLDVLESKRELSALRQRMSHQMRKSEQWPPFEIRAVRLDAGRVRLLMSYDVIFIDGWSRAILFSEWKALYEDVESALLPLELTFRDYVLAASRSRDSEAFLRAREYWRRRLADLLPAPRLPLTCDPAGLKQPRFNRRTTTLASEQWSALKGAAAKANITPSCVLLAAFADVLHRWSEEPGFSINLSLFNREPLHPQVNDIVGDFTSVTLLQVEPPDKTFEERACRLQRQLWQDFDHRQFSGIEVLRELARQGSAKHAAGMPVVFTSLLWDSDSSGRSVGHWVGERVYGVSQTPQVWIDCVVYEDRGSLVLLWDVVESLFAEGMLDAMFAAFAQHLVSLATEEMAWKQTWSDTACQLVPLAQLEIFKASNDTGGPVSHQLLDGLFCAQARLLPDRLALLSADRSLTYAELDNLSHVLAAQLRDLGVRPNTLVAVVMEKGWEQVVAVLGILKAGAAYLPIDASLPVERLQKLLTHGEVTIALTQSRHIAVIEWPDGLRTIAVDVTSPILPQEKVPTQGRSPDDLAYVIYTSGSTGEPKGVMIDHRGAVNTILDINSRFHVGPDDRVLALSSLSFDLSVYDIFGTLAAGAAIVIPEADGTRDPAHWADLINGHGVTVWNSVPSLMELLVEYVRHHPERRPKSLRLALLSGDWIPVALPDAIRSASEAAQLVSLGGATEASIWSILYPIDHVDPHWTSIPYGRPMRNQTFHVLDAHLLPCPIWVPGELFIGGAGLAKGYWRDQERSQASFFVHPRTGERLYRTGDMGRYLPAGNIEFLGRKDTQVKLQGYRAELGEIEATLSRHPGVSAVAVAVKGQRYGSKRLVAYVVAKRNQPAAPSELQAFVRQRLPDYMVPATYILLDAMPLTANGKVNRQALPEPPETSGPSENEEATQRSSLGQMRQLVAGVLGQDDLDTKANLLERGANSIDMIRIVNRIDEALGFRPRIGDLYRDPTIAGLTRSYEEYRRDLGVRASEEDGAPEPIGAIRVLTDPDEREAFKSTQAGLRRFGGEVPSIALITTPGDEATIRQYAQRRSYRNFSAAAVPFSQLSGLLGRLSPIGLEGQAKYLFGSAGSSYPVQTYVYAKPGRVESLPAGVYYYQPVERRFMLISGGACVHPEIYDVLINRPVFDAAAFAVFFVAQLGAIQPLYGEYSVSFVTIEAGLMTQLLEMTAPNHSIGLCQMGGLDSAPLHGPLALEAGHVLVHSLVGGLIDNLAAQEQKAADAWMEGEI